MNIQPEKPYPIYTLLEIAGLLDAELRISKDADQDVRIEGLQTQIRLVAIFFFKAVLNYYFLCHS